MTTTQVVLVGLMGSGKSTVGRLVAERTGRHLVDVDVAITTRTGRSVREIWEAGGEAAYRHLESAEVLAGLRSGDPVVVAAPGGVVLDPEVRTALSAALVVWLRADPAVLARRVGAGDHRPLLGDRPYEVLSTMARDRAALYGAVADAVVDVDTVDPEAAARTVVDLLQRCVPEMPEMKET
jgi:shikimate kinase